MKKKILWWTLSLAVIAAGAWAGYRYYEGNKEIPLAAAPATTQVRKGTIEVKVSGTGNIQPSARETVTAGASGTVKKVHAQKGDTVKKGDVLVTYEEEEIDNANQIRSKEIDLKKKKLELQDLQTKFKSAADDESRESIALSIQKQELDIESVQADIASLKEETADNADPVLAPIDGMLTSFNVKEGDVLNPNSTIADIVNYAQLQMVVGIDELDIPKVKLEQEASILVEALSDQTFTGKVVSIADEGTSSNGVASFDVTIALSAADNLKAGMSAEASILTAQKTDALYVPVEAVQSSQGKYFVLVPSAAAGGAEEDGAAPEGAAPSGQVQQGQRPGRQGQAVPDASGEAPQTGSGFGAVGADRFGNMSEDEREAMRERFMSERGQGGALTAAGASNVVTSRVEVEVGVNNEDNIEILSGLNEGDLVVLPTTSSSGSSNANMMQGGFPGLGGVAVPSGGGGMSGGAGGARQFTGGGAGAGMGGGR
ncbi:efflux RND transporter periplasmic adaptor subunit [Cohnella sp.]|uniref:efflux RND transporter periplasmic adaptor subunit n=1 Tax=Cohnella sp. TaxID=1883426 RepID=UPI003561C4A1